MTQGPGTYLNLAAGGNILPMSFVKFDTTKNETCIQSGAGDGSVGISGTWTRFAGGTPADDELEATDGEFPQVASIGCVVPLICGNAGTWTAGAYLMPDALGYGTPATGNGAVSSAWALDAATPGVHGRVLVITPGVR